MKRPESYNTKRREAVLSYIASLNGAHVTAARIAEHFEGGELPIGRTTVYRQLEKLTESGKIHRYSVDGVSGACFQYVDDESCRREQFHLKCEGCGELFHLECDAFEEILRHVFDEHNFQVNIMKTVLYGKCHECRHKSG